VGIVHVAPDSLVPRRLTRVMAARINKHSRRVLLVINEDYRELGEEPATRMSAFCREADLRRAFEHFRNRP
jgi:hypothetical protein